MPGDLYAQYAKTTVHGYGDGDGCGQDLCTSGAGLQSGRVGQEGAFNYRPTMGSQQDQHNGPNNNVCTITKDATPGYSRGEHGRGVV